MGFTVASMDLNSKLFFKILLGYNKIPVQHTISSNLDFFEFKPRVMCNLTYPPMLYVLVRVSMGDSRNTMAGNKVNKWDFLFMKNHPCRFKQAWCLPQFFKPISSEHYLNWFESDLRMTSSWGRVHTQCLLTSNSNNGVS